MYSGAYEHVEVEDMELEERKANKNSLCSLLAHLSMSWSGTDLLAHCIADSLLKFMRQKCSLREHHVLVSAVSFFKTNLDLSS